jgi:RNA polymerase sigma-70 factor (ECF subfamily)
MGVLTGELTADLAEAPGSAAQLQRRLSVAVTKHHQLVWRTLRRCGVPERDVDDAAQQVFLAFSQHLSELAAGKEAAYLAAIGVRVAANARRKLERSPEVLSEELDAAPVGTTPESLLGEKQLREELDRGLLTLPIEQRAVFVLYELEGFSLPEIADALQIPLGTATSRLRRARGHFEAWVAGRSVHAGDEP